MKKLKILAVLFVLVTITNVHAVLQSRPGVNARDNTTVSNFFKLIREMEAENSSLGLNAQFAENSSTKEYEETTESNNVDSHMCKNTEWGAVAMLSASDYGAGNGNVTSSSHSTTGNMTGVFGTSGYGEYVAGGIVSKMNSSYCKYLMNASIRYIDRYAERSSYSDPFNYIPGDATYETKTFKGGATVFVTNSSPVFLRGTNTQTSFGSQISDGQATAWGLMVSRGCLWVGEGL